MHQDSPTRAASRHVFVYGTLRRGQANDIMALQPAPAWVGRASVHGTLYDLGRYPGVVLGGTALVRGEVYEIAPALEEKLDEIEMIYPQQRDEYFKRELSVAVALEAVRRAASMTLDEVLAQDMVLAEHLVPGPDFIEGVRAQLVDKDRNPRWQHARLEDVTRAEVLAAFAGLAQTV